MGNCKQSQQVRKARRQRIIYRLWAQGYGLGLGSLKDDIEAKFLSPTLQDSRQGAKGTREVVERASTHSLELNPKPSY